MFRYIYNMKCARAHIFNTHLYENKKKTVKIQKQRSHFILYKKLTEKYLPIGLSLMII